MLTKNLIRIFVLCIFGISLFSCKTEEIILHGDIKGTITDAETSLPIPIAKIRLNQSNDSTITGIDGVYLFEKIPSGDYEVQASKYSYYSQKENVKVLPAKTQTVDFKLNKLPIPNLSVNYLDFGADLDTLPFTLTGISMKKINYSIFSNQTWMTFYPSNGEITNETDSIYVTIDRKGLSKNIYEDTIKIIFIAGFDIFETIIPVYINGFFWLGIYHNIVKIGTQIWMVKNLNVGINIWTPYQQSDNGIIEKYCYDNAEYNCNIYGGLYQWDEMMQYNPPDNGLIGTTQGICPDGWHIPTKSEWTVLSSYVSRWGYPGGALKDTGTVHWETPNAGATNKSGFTMLGAGDYLYWDESCCFENMSWWAEVWSSSSCTNVEWCRLSFETWYEGDNWVWWEIKKSNYEYPQRFAASVRCIKDP
jgi:uncharacterized protein (TIGR02145 family)